MVSYNTVSFLLKICHDGAVADLREREGHISSRGLGKNVLSKIKCYELNRIIHIWIELPTYEVNTRVQNTYAHYIFLYLPLIRKSKIPCGSVRVIDPLTILKSIKYILNYDYNYHLSVYLKILGINIIIIILVTSPCVMITNS